MRKAGLLDIEPLLATSQMLAKARADVGKEIVEKYSWSSSTYRYTEWKTKTYLKARDIPEKHVLEIDAYYRPNLQRGETAPTYRIFLDYEEMDYITYNVGDKKWSKARYEYLTTYGNAHSYAKRPEVQITKQDLKLIQSKLSVHELYTAEFAIREWQEAIAKEKRDRKNNRELQAIDDQMAIVPELPKSWDKWIEDVPLMKHEYLIYTKEQTAYCTHCRETVALTIKPKHNETGKCPSCKHDITYKSWGMQKYLHTRTKASIIQRCSDGKSLVVRQFFVLRKLNRDSDYKGTVEWHEDYRGFTNEHLASGLNAYEWGVYKNTHTCRWCRYGTVNHGGYYNNQLCQAYASGVLFTGNLKHVLKDTVIKYVPAAEIFRAVKGERIDVEETLTTLRDNRNFYEAIWKMGLHRFAIDRLFKRGGLTQIDKAGKPWECLRLPKRIFMQAVRLDLSDTGVRILQILERYEVRVTDDELKWLEKHMGASSLLRYICWQTPHRFIKYMSSEPFGRVGINLAGSRGIYADYLDMAQKLGMNLGDRSVCFPQDLQRAHDEAATLIHIRKDEEAAAKRAKEEARLRENAKAIREMFDYADEQFFILVPESYKEISDEGHEQHNCVATYFEPAAAGRTIIFFVRRKEEPEKSFCTVEIGKKGEEFVIKQNFIAYNRKAPADETEFLKKAVAAAQKKVDKELKKKAKQVRVAVAV